jgi:hypothetical protein
MQNKTNFQANMVAKQAFPQPILDLSINKVSFKIKTQYQGKYCVCSLL